MQLHIQIYRNVQLKQGPRVFIIRSYSGAGGGQSKTRVGKQTVVVAADLERAALPQLVRGAVVAEIRQHCRDNNTPHSVINIPMLTPAYYLGYLSTKPRFTLRPTVFRDRPLTKSSMHNSVTILHKTVKRQNCVIRMFQLIFAHTYTQKILVNLFNVGT